MGDIARYLSPQAMQRPDWSEPSDWLGHLPFLLWLVGTLGPEQAVMLGAGEAVGYFGLCQAVAAAGASTVCQGIDDWLAEDAAGHYGEHRFRALIAHHDPRYGHFSRLVRIAADEAADRFGEGTVDLLILDGNHNYEAQSRLFAQWRSRLSARGLLLLPGIARPELGASALWRDLVLRQPSAFVFPHCGGLGLLAFGAVPAPLAGLFGANAAETAEIRGVYGRLGGLLAAEQDLRIRHERSLAEGAALKARFDELQQQYGTLATANQQHIDRWLECRRDTEHHLASAQVISADLAALQDAYHELAARFDATERRLQAQFSASQGLLGETQRQLADSQRQLVHSRQRIDALLTSRSWRITRPLRDLAERLGRSDRAIPACDEPKGAARPGDQPAPSSETEIAGEGGAVAAAAGMVQTGEVVSGEPATADPGLAEVVSPIGAGDDTPAGEEALLSPAAVDLRTELAAIRTRRLAGQMLPAAGDDASRPPARLDHRISVIFPLNANGKGEIGGALLAGIPGIELIEAREPGPAGRNRAASAARGDLLLFLSADLRPASDAVAALQAAFADPSVGAATPLLLDPEGRVLAAGWRLRRDGSAHPLGLGESAAEARFSRIRPVDFAAVCCLMVRAAAFRALGGFDEAFPADSLEDADLALGLRAGGLSTLLVPTARVAVLAPLPVGDRAGAAQRLLEKWPEALETVGQVDLVAFYHPTFYPTLETDRWFGAGHSDWRHLDRPAALDTAHRPADLGYYDQRLAETAAAQEALARRYGLSGFCHLYYNFGGRRLFALPQERLLAGAGQSFCLCWMNADFRDPETGTRLLDQDYSIEAEQAVIADLARYLQMPTYRRVEGRPLLLVEDVRAFPDFSLTAGRWRAFCRDAGIGEIHLAMLGTDCTDPAEFGCCSLVARPIDPAEAGSRLDYAACLRGNAAMALPGYRRFGMVPAWHDGPCRQGSTAFTVAGADAGVFGLWLEMEIDRARQTAGREARLIFLRSWNGWAEGAYLEPDLANGHAYLEAVRDAAAADDLLAGRQEW